MSQYVYERLPDKARYGMLIIQARVGNLDHECPWYITTDSPLMLSKNIHVILDCMEWVLCNNCQDQTYTNFRYESTRYGSEKVSG